MAVLLDQSGASLLDESGGTLLDEAGAAVQNAAASVIATSALIVVARVTRRRQVSIAATSAMAAVGAIGSAYARQVSIASASSLSVTARRTVRRQVAVAAASSASVSATYTPKPLRARAVRPGQFMNGGELVRAGNYRGADMDVFSLKQDDTAPALRFRLFPRSVDLTGATVIFNMKSRDDGTVKVNRASAEIVSATGQPEVQYEWSAGDTDTVGSFHGEFEVTYADGSVETFPSGEFIRIKIGEDIA